MSVSFHKQHSLIHNSMFIPVLSRWNLCFYGMILCLGNVSTARSLSLLNIFLILFFIVHIFHIANIFLLSFWMARKCNCCLPESFLLYFWGHTAQVKTTRISERKVYEILTALRWIILGAPRVIWHLQPHITKQIFIKHLKTFHCNTWHHKPVAT